MPQSKQEKQQKALDALTASIAADMNNEIRVSFQKRQEYNSLKKALGYELPKGRTFWLL